MGIFGLGKRDSLTDDIDDEWALEPAHEDFAAHFTDPIYEEPGNDFAPFGSDEGAETIATWSQRGDELSDATTVREMFLTDQDDFWNDAVAEAKGEPGYEEHVDGSALLVSYAFTLLRVTGRIDQEGQELAVAALDHLIDYYGHEQEELQIQRRDLATWVNPSE